MKRGPLHIPAPFFLHPVKKRESFKRAPVELPFIGFFSYVKLPTGSFIRWSWRLFHCHWATVKVVCKGYHPSIKMPGRKIRPLYEKSSSPSDLCFSNQAGSPLQRLITVRLRRQPCSVYVCVCVCVCVCVFPSNIRKIKGVISVHKASDQTSSEVCDRQFKHFMDHWCWQVDHTGLKQMFSEKMNVWDLKRAALFYLAILVCEVLLKTLLKKPTPLKRVQKLLTSFH